MFNTLNSIDDLFGYINTNYTKIISSSVLIKEVWKCAGRLGVFSNKNEGFSTYLLEKLSEYDLYDFPFWLQRNVIIHLFETCASPIQKERYLSKLYSGEYIASIALTEYTGGSSFQNIQSTFVLQNNKYTIQGEKIYISCAKYADIFLYSAKDASGSINLFILENVSDKLIVEPIDCIEGLKGLGISKITLNPHQINADSLLLTSNQALFHLTSILSYERFCCAYTSLMISKKILSFALKWAKQRGIMDYQSIAFNLSELYSEHLLLENYFSSKKRDFDQYHNILFDAAVLKHQSVNLALNTYQYCARLIAGNFICIDKELNLTRLHNVLIALSAAGGTQEVMKRIITEKIKTYDIT